MKAKIKIVFSGNFPFGGAAANYVRNLAHCLSDSYDTEVLLTKGYFFGEVSRTDYQQPPKLDDIKFRYLHHHIQPIHPLLRILGNLVGTLKALYFIAKDGWRGGVDVVVVYDMSFLVNLPILLICRLFNIKIVNILVEYYPKTKGFGLIWIHNFFFYVGVNYLIKYNSGVIALSNFLIDFTKKKGFSGEFILLPNIVDPNFFSKSASPFIENVFTIGYAGTPTVKDGIEDLLNGFSRIHKSLPNTHLLIIGDTLRQSSIPYLRNIAVDLNIEKAVTFSGLRSLNEVANLLNSCDVLVLARPAGVQAEAGFPTKLGEYFSCRKPVVVTRVGDIGRYFVDGDVVQLVEPDNVESIAGGILAVINNPQRRHLLANNGFDWMMQHLSIVSAKEKLERFISSLLDKRIEE